eukprot:124073_1
MKKKLNENDNNCIQYMIKFKKCCAKNINNVSEIDDNKFDDWNEIIIENECNEYELKDLDMKSWYIVCGKCKINNFEWSEYSNELKFETLKNPYIDVIELCDNSELKCEYNIPYVFKSIDENDNNNTVSIGCERYELIGKEEQQNKIRIYFPYVNTIINDVNQWCRVYGGKWNDRSGVNAGKQIGKWFNMKYSKICDETKARYQEKYPNDAQNNLIQVYYASSGKVEFSSDKGYGKHGLPWVELKSNVPHIKIIKH